MLEITANDLISFEIQEKETHLKIYTDCDLAEKALAYLFTLRSELESFIARDPKFKNAYSSHPVPFFKTHQLIKNMAWAARKCKVGPMAAVAGAIAELMGQELLKYSREALVINGKALFIKTATERQINIPKTNYALKISSVECPLAISTLNNLGTADALIVKSNSGALADAGVTAIGNFLRNPVKHDDVIKFSKKIRGLKGVLFLRGNFLGGVGKIEIESLN